MNENPLSCQTEKKTTPFTVLCRPLLGDPVDRLSMGIK